MLKRSLVFLIVFAVFSITLKAQKTINEDIAAIQSDSVLVKKTPFKGLLPIPALSYSPETKFTMGVALIYTFQLAKGDTTSRKSNIQFNAIYTTAKQTILEGKWELFTKDELYYLQGQAFYHKYPNRHYGQGNNAGAVVEVLKDEQPLQIQNYVQQETKRLNFSTAILRKVRPSFYLGLDYEFESLYDYKNGFRYTNIKTPELYQNPTTGKRSGLGLAFAFDNRDNVINAYKGHLLEIRTRNYGKYFGSDYTFLAIDLDYRTYKRIYKDQVFAFNFVSQSRLAETAERLPIRALARLGGTKLVRGYFLGSYQDRYLLAFQTEYRVPVFSFPKFIIKGLGLVAFFNGGRTFNAPNEFNMKGFRLSTGAGLRLTFNEYDRVNIGIDYAVGLHKHLGKRPSGIYFSIGETF